MVIATIVNIVEVEVGVPVIATMVDIVEVHVGVRGRFTACA